mgnify:CR=1 FL=1
MYAIPQARAKYISSEEPNISTLRIIDAMGQFTAPQNTATSAIAAAKGTFPGKSDE